MPHRLLRVSFRWTCHHVMKRGHCRKLHLKDHTTVQYTSENLREVNMKEKNPAHATCLLTQNAGTTGWRFWCHRVKILVRQGAVECVFKSYKFSKYFVQYQVPVSVTNYKILIPQPTRHVAHPPPLPQYSLFTIPCTLRPGYGADQWLVCKLPSQTLIHRASWAGTADKKIKPKTKSVKISYFSL